MNRDVRKSTIHSDNQHERALREILRPNRSWPCLHPGCADKCIYSHAISKSISLETIAESGHLQTVRSQRQGDIKTLDFDRIGIKQATAFNGFCATHDDLFKSLDTREIADSKSLFLQAYRSVMAACCTESRIAKLMYEGRTRADIEAVLDARAADDPRFRDERVRAQVRSRYKEIADSEKKRADALMHLPQELLERFHIIESRPLDHLVTVATEQSSHAIVFRRVGFRIPVALNAKLTILADKVLQDFYFTVIPYAAATVVMGVMPKAINARVRDRLEHGFASDIAALDLVESIIACCNEWYMTPSVLAEMSEAKRQVFLHDSICYTEQRFHQEYDMTLFDGLRKTLAQRHPESAAQLRLEQIDAIPRREDFAARHKRMMEALVSQSVKLHALDSAPPA
ncbi:hypothetical protein [Duganella sp. HH101]|uniref:hypothetical protein n=1 Tax=Duganella sp. HH101 TaxID=1781066 RepID=UPI0008931BC4|nr:hypothetical protein [Duganella sp. HH101]OFA00308.1 hypothetical protein DUGA2_48490 [Duganella sp. HH101]